MVCLADGVADGAGVDGYLCLAGCRVVVVAWSPRSLGPARGCPGALSWVSLAAMARVARVMSAVVYFILGGEGGGLLVLLVIIGLVYYNYWASQVKRMFWNEKMGLL